MTLHPTSVSIGEISITDPLLDVAIDTEGTSSQGKAFQGKDTADVEAKTEAGTLSGGTNFSFKGKIKPLIENRYSDLEVVFSGFNLNRISTYSVKYAGYAIDRGNLSFDLTYKVSQSELKGENVVVIDQLTLGSKVESKDAVKLPIPLAVALVPGGDDVNLSMVGFVACSYLLVTESSGKLDLLSRALQERPVLRLRMIPSAGKLPPSGRLPLRSN